MARTCFAYALVLLSVACSKTPSEPAPAERPVVTSATAAAASYNPPPATGSAPSPSTASSSASGPNDVAFDAPSSWTSMPNPNSMRKATYKIPRAAGDADDGELTFSTASGGVEQNVTRWAHQFGDAKPTTEKKKVNGMDVTVIEIKGKYNGGGPGMNAPPVPKDDWMLLGAIVDAGDKQHFLKMVGPSKTLTAAKKDFDKLVASLRAK